MRPNYGKGLRGPGSRDLPGGLTDLADPAINWDDLQEARRLLHSGWAELGLLDDIDTAEEEFFG